MVKAALEVISRYYKENDEELHREFEVWQKVRKFKQLISEGKINLEHYSDGEQMLINKIMIFMEKLPPEYHKCIGCPCNEHDYPKCEVCPYYVYCIKGITPYPSGCRDGDCQRMRRRIVNIE